MIDTGAALLTWAEQNVALAGIVAAVGLVALFLGWRLLRVVWRIVVRAWRSIGASLRRIRQEGRTEDVLTYVAATLASFVTASGMWKFFESQLSEIPFPLRVVMFAFIELAVFTSALRARRTMRRIAQRIADGESWLKASGGLDHKAVWGLTVLTAVLSALEAGKFGEVVFRLSAPFVAAWLWERGMAIEREKITKRRSSIAWRLTPERLLVALRLADPTERNAGEVAVQRYLTRLALAANTIRQLPANTSERKKRKAEARYLKRMDEAVEYANLAANTERMSMLMEQLRLLFNAGDLPHVQLSAPWRAWQDHNDQETAHLLEREAAEALARLREEPPSLEPDPGPGSGGGIALPAVFASRPHLGDTSAANGQHALNGSPRDESAHADAFAELSEVFTPNTTDVTNTAEHSEPAVSTLSGSGAEMIRAVLAETGVGPYDATPEWVVRQVADRGGSVTMDNARTTLYRERGKVDKAMNDARVTRLKSVPHDHQGS